MSSNVYDILGIKPSDDLPDTMVVEREYAGYAATVTGYTQRIEALETSIKEADKQRVAAVGERNRVEEKLIALRHVAAGKCPERLFNAWGSSYALCPNKGQGALAGWCGVHWKHGANELARQDPEHYCTTGYKKRGTYRLSDWQYDCEQHRKKKGQVA